MEEDFFPDEPTWKRFAWPEIKTPHMRRSVSQSLYHKSVKVAEHSFAGG